MAGEGAWNFKQLLGNHPLFCCRQSFSAMPLLFWWLSASDGLSTCNSQDLTLYTSVSVTGNLEIGMWGWFSQQLLSATNIHSFVGYHKLCQLCPAFSLLILLDPKHPCGKTTCLYLVNLRTGGNINLLWFDILGLAQPSLDLCALPALTVLEKLFRLPFYFPS